MDKNKYSLENPFDKEIPVLTTIHTKRHNDSISKLQKNVFSFHKFNLQSNEDRQKKIL